MRLLREGKKKKGTDKNRPCVAPSRNVTPVSASSLPDRENPSLSFRVADAGSDGRRAAGAPCAAMGIHGFGPRFLFSFPAGRAISVSTLRGCRRQAHWRLSGCQKAAGFKTGYLLRGAPKAFQGLEMAAGVRSGGTHPGLAPRPHNRHIRARLGGGALWLSNSLGTRSHPHAPKQDLAGLHPSQELCFTLKLK